MQVSQEDGVYVPSLNPRRLQLFQQNAINTAADVRDHVGVGIGAAKSRIYQQGAALGAHKITLKVNPQAIVTRGSFCIGVRIPLQIWNPGLWRDVRKSPAKWQRYLCVVKDCNLDVANGRCAVRHFVTPDG